MRLKKRLLITFFLLSVLPMILYSGITGWLNYKSSIAEMRELDTQQAKELSARLQAFFDEFAVQIDTTVKASRLHKLSSENQLKVLQILMSDRLSYREGFILDVEGNVTAAFSNKRSLKNISFDFTQTDSYLVPLRTGESYASLIIYDVKTGEPHIRYSAPIFDATNRNIKGIIILEFRTKKIWDIISDTRSDKSFAAYVLDPSSRVIAHKNLTNVLKQKFIFIGNDELISERGLLGRKAFISRENFYFGQQVFTIVVEQAESEITAQAINSIYVLIVIFVALTICIIIATMVISSKIVNPLMHISKAIQAIRDGDIGRQLPVTSKDEVGELADTFNMMSAYLQETLVALENEVIERRAAQDELLLAASVFNNSTEGIVITDLDSNILSVNPAFTKITGYREEEAIGKTPRVLKSGHHEDSFYAKLWEKIVNEGKWQGEIWNRRKNGEIFISWQTINCVKDNDGNPIQYMSIMNDISELLKKEEHIRHIEMHDSLTNLPNRSYLQSRINELLSKSKERLVMILIDIDRFKLINDTKGHDFGDMLLIETAKIIKNTIPPACTLTRFGGDEFALLIERMNSDRNIAMILKNLKHELKHNVSINGENIQVTFSAGVSVTPDDGTTSLDLFKCADTAMYAAKSAGKDTFKFYSSDMNTLTARRLQIEYDMRNAIENNDFTLYYQPKISLTDHKIVGAEALIRWIHPEQGFIPPSDFIPIAEEAGLINDIGDWVIDETFRQLSYWKDGGKSSVNISINISPVQIMKRDIARKIKSASGAFGISANSIEVEFTESTVMENIDECLDVISELNTMGVNVSIDDFGTGYSSLSYLKKLPVKTLKIDRSFVTDCDNKLEDLHIIRTIIVLAQALGLSTVAEGVETIEHVRVLKEIGCDIAQGYHYARPMPADEFIEFLENHDPEKYI